MSTSGEPSRSAANNAIRKPRKSRGRGLRATTGCKICRKRHMKCDEAKPVCGPCSKSDRPCEYDNPPAVPASGHNGVPGATQTRERAPSKPAGNAYPWPREQVTLARDQNGEDSYATETAPVRWFGLLSTDTAEVDLGAPSARSPDGTNEAHGPPTRPDVMQVSTIAPSAAAEDSEERAIWQSQEPLQLRGLEYDVFQHFVTAVSGWIDMLDSLRHFATLVPRLALHNEGLMKAILAVGAQHLAAKAAEGSCDVLVFKHAAVQYYSETLQYLQSAMRCASYKNSQELLATTLIASAYEMIDGAGKGWERHLKGVFWIQRTREINGESGGLEQAVWWAWIHQDVWAAFRERRRCYSFSRPTKPYGEMNTWDVASRSLYLLAQCVNFISDEDGHNAAFNASERILRADELARMLEEWHANKGVAFEPLPQAQRSDEPFKPIWIHPPAFALSVQMYHAAHVLLASHRPDDRYQDDLDRGRDINESVDTIAGIAIQLSSEPARAFSKQYLFAAGLFCRDEARQRGILEVIGKGATSSDWPSGSQLQDELQARWSKN